MSREIQFAAFPASGIASRLNWQSRLDESDNMKPFLAYLATAAIPSCPVDPAGYWGGSIAHSLDVVLKLEKSLRQPVLTLNGGLDSQVPRAPDLPAIRTALMDNPHATLAELAQLNHLFQTTKTGTVDEYATIEETIAPAALDVTGNWILATTRRNNNVQ